MDEEFLGEKTGQRNFPSDGKKDAVYLLGEGGGPAWESLTTKHW